MKSFGLIQRMRIENRDEDAFTLVELLLAMAILAIVVSTIFGGFISSHRTFRAVERKSDVYQMARTALDRIVDEINAAYIDSNIARGRFIGQDITTGDRAMDRLDFTSHACFNLPGVRTMPGQVETVIAYFVTEGSDGEIYLLRQEYGMNDPLYLDPPVYKGDPAQFGNWSVVASNVLSIEGNIYHRFKGFDLRYYYISMDELGDWYDDWDALEGPMRGQLPRAVEINLIFADDTEKELIFSTRTPIHIG
ncbi:PilW family protein [Thermodesulfobacteriota bacterium]